MPMTASIATLLCTISASRYHLMEFSSPPINHDLGGLLEKPAGSNPTSPAKVPSRLTGRGSNGRATDLSSITILKDLAPDLIGATNAVAPTREAAITVRANMVQVLIDNAIGCNLFQDMKLLCRLHQDLSLLTVHTFIPIARFHAHLDCSICFQTGNYVRNFKFDHYETFNV